MTSNLALQINYRIFDFFVANIQWFSKYLPRFYFIYLVAAPQFVAKIIAIFFCPWRQMILRYWREIIHVSYQLSYSRNCNWSYRLTLCEASKGHPLSVYYISFKERMEYQLFVIMRGGKTFVLGCDEWWEWPPHSNITIYEYRFSYIAIASSNYVLFVFLFIII